MSYFQALILAIIEGITEFLPISSTGHMIITGALVKTTNTDFTKLFIVNIQFGAILSVIVLYWKKFFQSFDFYLKLFIAFIPAAIIGFLFNDYIDMLLESVLVVAISLVIGGVFLLFVDKIFERNETIAQTNLSKKSSFIIGFFQVIAMIPGVSRSAATIVGGLTQKLNRKNAAEFSFFLAVPTMAAASGYKLIKAYEIIKIQDIKILLFGNVIAFIVALIAIKTFIGFVSKYGFKLFGYYRIALGLGLIILILLGYKFTIY